MDNVNAVVPVQALKEFNLVNHGVFKEGTLYFVSEELANVLVRRNLIEIKEIKEKNENELYKKKSKNGIIETTNKFI